MPLNDPAHVARLVGPYEEWFGELEPRAENALDGPHGLEEPPLLLFGEPVEQLRYLLARTGIEHAEGLEAFGGKGENAPPAIGLGGSFLDEAPALQAGQRATEITRVQPQLAREVGGSCLLAVGHLEQHAGLGQRVWRVEQTLAWNPDPARKEAVEAPDGL